jgi:hypothetical protein
MIGCCNRGLLEASCGEDGILDGEEDEDEATQARETSGVQRSTAKLVRIVSLFILLTVLLYYYIGCVN